MEVTTVDLDLLKHTDIGGKDSRRTRFCRKRCYANAGKGGGLIEVKGRFGPGPCQGKLGALILSERCWIEVHRREKILRSGDARAAHPARSGH